MKKVQIIIPRTLEFYYNKIDADCWGAQRSANEDYNFLLDLIDKDYEAFLTGNFYGYGAMVEVEFHFNNNIKIQYIPKKLISVVAFADNI